MTRSLNLRGADVEAIASVLASGSPPVDLPPGTPSLVVDNQEVLATAIADAVRSGGGEPQGSLVDYVVAVVLASSEDWLWLHTSSAGDGVFPDPFWDRAAPDLLGTDAASHLLARPLAGLDPPGGRTRWGHLTAAEVTELSGRLAPVDPTTPEVVDLTRLVDVIRQAASRGLGLVTAIRT